MGQVLYINAVREGYEIDQIRHTMTVGQLMNWLSSLTRTHPCI